MTRISDPEVAILVKHLKDCALRDKTQVTMPLGALLSHVRVVAAADQR